MPELPIRHITPVSPHSSDNFLHKQLEVPLFITIVSPAKTEPLQQKALIPRRVENSNLGPVGQMQVAVIEWVMDVLS